MTEAGEKALGLDPPRAFSGAPGDFRIGVIQVIDCLALGGAERMAVNVANALPRDRFASHLCVTRFGGPLAAEIAPWVRVLHLKRKRRWSDPWAALRLAHYVGRNNIRILHAHKDSIFFAALTSMGTPAARLVWHDHYGKQDMAARPARLYRRPLRQADAVIAVTEHLADWSRDTLGVAWHQVHYIPNFTGPPLAEGSLSRPAIDGAANGPVLAGGSGARLLCVANLRPQKDASTLLAAMAIVRTADPRAHLSFAGRFADAEYGRDLVREVEARSLGPHVTFLGEQPDVTALLPQADVCVLSSSSEGLPVALLEYGLAARAVVVTDVGQCAEVVANGEAGLVVPAKSPPALADAILKLLRSSELRTALGARLRQRVTTEYGPDTTIRRIVSVYDEVLSE